jgi:tetratricopeptide (TPR) repeat protein
VVDFIASDDKRSQLSYGNERVNYMPTNKLKFPVDSATVVENGTVDPEDADKIVSEVKWTLNQNNLMKSGLMILDLLAHNNWERPVYFVSPSSEANLGLRKYLQLEGFAYRLVPIETPTEGRIDVGKINTDKMYENLMHEFKWGNMQDTSVYIDYTTRRTSNVIRIRNKFARLAEALIEKGKKNEAVQVLDKAMELTPHSQFPYNIWTVEVIKQYYNADAIDKANKLTEEFAGYLKGELDYYTSLNSPYNKLVDRNEVFTVSNDNAMEMARKLAREEGIFSGLSSGAIFHAALEISKRKENKGKNIVVIVCDTGERYLSTPLFNFDSD